MPQMNMIQALNSAMDIMLARDPNVVMLGEDIGYFGGVFRVTDGLQRKYGEHRVLDTPIAEGAIVGAAIEVLGQDYPVTAATLVGVAALWQPGLVIEIDAMLVAG